METKAVNSNQMHEPSPYNKSIFN